MSVTIQMASVSVYQVSREVCVTSANLTTGALPCMETWVVWSVDAVRPVNTLSVTWRLVSAVANLVSQVKSVTDALMVTGTWDLMVVNSVPVTLSLLLVEDATLSMVNVNVFQVFRGRIVMDVNPITSSFSLRTEPMFLIGRNHLIMLKDVSLAQVVLRI